MKSSYDPDAIETAKVLTNFVPYTSRQEKRAPVYDYVTILQSSRPCNKRVYIQADGTLAKEPVSTSGGVARAVALPDQAAMLQLLEDLGGRTDHTLILGYIPGTENGQPYRIIPKDELASALSVDPKSSAVDGLHELHGDRYAARTNSNFRSSSWVVFDYDPVPGMPEGLVYSDPLLWWSAMTDLLPGLVGAGDIPTRSTSSRVLRDGKPTFDKGGWHAFVQVIDADDVVRFGHEVMIKAMTTRHGFIRPTYSRESGEVSGHRPWGIFDPPTFASERLVFDGQPIVKGEGLSVAPVHLQAVSGGRFDSATLVLDEGDAEALRRTPGMWPSPNLYGQMFITVPYHTTSPRRRLQDACIFGTPGEDPLRIDVPNKLITHLLKHGPTVAPDAPPVVAPQGVERRKGGKPTRRRGS